MAGCGEETDVLPDPAQGVAEWLASWSPGGSKAQCYYRAGSPDHLLASDPRHGLFHSVLWPALISCLCLACLIVRRLRRRFRLRHGVADDKLSRQQLAVTKERQEEEHEDQQQVNDLTDLESDYELQDSDDNDDVAGHSGSLLTGQEVTGLKYHNLAFTWT